MSNYSRRGSFRGQNRGNRASSGYRQKRRFGGGNRFRNPGLDLNPMMFVKRAVEGMEVSFEPENSFSSFALDKIVIENVLKRGFDKPTAVQDKAIPPILEGRDLVGVANTGTGKTAAFLLPLITKIIRNKSEKVLIVTPTRELAEQIQTEFRFFSAGMSLFSVLCIGGASINRQIQDLYRNPNFVIGTPGRIKDLENRGKLNLKSYTNVVLDEVDRMLDMGFIHDIREIVSLLSTRRQSLFFSATLPDKIKMVMQSFLSNPVMVQVKTGATAANVDQDIVKIKGRDKADVLHQLLIGEGFDKVLVFGRTKWGINKLEINLSRRGFRVASIHGNKTQAQRSRALRMLKDGKVSVLLATDVASRGIDIEDITHVINFDVPASYDDYVHRIGRTGRAGKKGVALTFID